ncbi:uncharacterized protein FOMMEDRAFT_150579 [Fomitiporia mediterranea MF3/22]|uniref:uncharacterized protein n=1 Tax=Fomitiporia mediterranea (strain MF3/22) TaxID=694068 RepID=UPI0004407BC1|nr:uncharacterized protein FOMMEDRAFT_150579 [Fomitiporia mediterranea MF3/22]EJD07968.1 hypothetical protein FOMMEDRAFT_150579 [Fomitiporia mediterranea MF3/22]
MATADLRLTYGAMFIGSVISVFLSGIGTLQAYMYFRHYGRKDSRVIRLMVLAVWILDFIHTVFICHAVWNYLVLNWGNLQELDRLIWSIGASIGVTGLVTFIVQMFFTFRVWRFSKRNKYLGICVTCMAAVRLGSALATSVEMIRLGHYSTFIREFRWLFTAGLALSCFIEILLTSSLCYYLQINRTGYSTMDEIIHRLLMYTVSNGLITTFASLLAMLFAATMPHNFLFISLHFVIAKTYINSVLATLNSRDALKKRDDSNLIAVQISVEGHSQPHFRRYNPNNRSPPVSDNRGIALATADHFAEDERQAGDLKVHVHVEQAFHSDEEMEGERRLDSCYKMPPLSLGDDVQRMKDLRRLE